jgi:hypothetical protein
MEKPVDNKLLNHSNKQPNKSNTTITHAVPQIRIPSNIMIKSSFLQFNSREPTYMTETILELYKYILNTNPSQYSSLEVEAKLGLFDFKGSCVTALKDIKDPFKLPLYNKADKNYSHFKYDFNSGLSENQFYTLWFFVNEECEKKGSDIIPIEPINYKETHFKSGIRRSIAYKNNQIIKEELIVKKDKHHINIRNMGKDFRITSCIEAKQSVIDYDDVPINYREKFRVSYKFRYFRLDFTVVASYKNLDVDSSKEMTYEVEFEFVELQKFLLNEYKNFEDFKMMFQRFVQNIFCIYELLTPEMFYYSEYNKRSSDVSIFGDYFKKNI